MNKNRALTVVLSSILMLNTASSMVVANEQTQNYEKSVEQDKSLHFESDRKSIVTFQNAFEQIPKTFEVRIKLAAKSGKRQVIMGNYVAGKNCFSLELTTANQLRYVEYAYNGSTMLTGIDIKVDQSKLVFGEWTMLSVIRDTVQNKVIILNDGEIISETSLDGVGTNQLQNHVPLDTPHYLGTDARKQFFLDADISQVRLWDEIRSIESIQEGLTSEVDGSEANLQHAYLLNINDLNTSNTVIRDVKEQGIQGIASDFDFPDAPVYQKSGTDFSLNDKDLEMVSVLEEIPMTMETWVKISPDKKGTRSVIAGNYFDSYYKGIPLMNFEITANGEPRIYWNIESTAIDYSAKGVNVYTGDWMHIAVSTQVDPKNSDQMIFTTYINGEKVHSQTLKASLVKLTQPMKIGEDTRFAHYLKGSLSDLRIWSTTRSADEIKENFEQTIPADADGLLGNWLLDEENDGVYKDRSTYANDVTSYWFDGDFMKKAEDGYETIAVIPDTQSLAAWAPNSFSTMTSWMRDHAETLGMKLAVHVGDIVNERDSQTEWNNALNSMQLLDGMVPYVFSPGNHDTAIQKVDGIWYGKRDTTKMNQTFTYDAFSQKDHFGGTFEEGKMDNSYNYFTIANMDFMTISLEQNPRDEVLDWANQIASENPDKRILITTHEYLYYDGQPTNFESQDHLPFIGGSNNGSQVWEKFASKHKNIVAVISGHVGYPDLLMNEAYGENGNMVQQILCDAQFMDRDDVNNGSKKGLGMIMLLSMKEGSDEVYINWFSTVRQQYFRVQNQFSSTMELQKSQEKTMRIVLKNAIDKTKVLLDHEDFQTLAPAVQNLIQTCYQEAISVYDDATSSDEQILNAWKNLAEALQYADFQADKGMLETLVNECLDIDLTSYTDESVEAFEKALEKAELVLQDDTALQERINQTYDALLDAKNNLREEPTETVDKTALRTIIQAAEEALQNEDLYKHDANWDAMLLALENANHVSNDVDAKQAEVNEASAALASAYTSIRLLPNEALLAQLTSFIETVSTLNRSLYREDHLALMDETVIEVQNLLQQEIITKQEETTILEKVQMVLTIIEQEQINETLDNVNKDQTHTEEATQKSADLVGNTVKTGVETKLVPSLITLLLTGGLLGGLRIKRKKQTK